MNRAEILSIRLLVAFFGLLLLYAYKMYSSNENYTFLQTSISTPTDLRIKHITHFS